MTIDEVAFLVDPHIMKAIAKAWSWRRQLDTGMAATIDDLARAEGVTHRYVGRTMRLAYLAPDVLDRLLVQRAAPAISLKEMIIAADLPWAEQEAVLFGA